jgi:DNA-binding response OmpR family regulator
MPQVRILVVDDDPAINELIQVTLRLEGWKISSARDGEEAIRIVHEKLPDLIILDMMMPKMDGLEVCRHVTSLFPIPVIMVSAQCDMNAKIRCFNMGAEDFVTKPFRAAELVDHVKVVLNRRNLA